MIIGVTGQIGSGKSTAAKILASLGATVIDADQIGREVVERSSHLRRELVRAFGPAILTSSGQLNRRALARLAFADNQSQHKLNRLVHPHLLRTLRQRVKEAARDSRVVVIDAALLLDWGMDREVDLVLLIRASRKRRFERLRERGIDLEDAVAREKAQLPFEIYQRRSDVVITNVTTASELAKKLKAFWQRAISKRN